MSEPYLPWGEIADIMRPDGSHPLWDRDDVHEIYAEWRRILIPTTRPVTRWARPRYIRLDERGTHQRTDLGNAFNFAMQDAIGAWRTIVVPSTPGWPT